MESNWRVEILFFFFFVKWVNDNLQEKNWCSYDWWKTNRQKFHTLKNPNLINQINNYRSKIYGKIKMQLEKNSSRNRHFTTIRIIDWLMNYETNWVQFDWLSLFIFSICCAPFTRSLCTRRSFIFFLRKTAISFHFWELSKIIKLNFVTENMNWSRNSEAIRKSVSLISSNSGTHDFRLEFKWISKWTVIPWIEIINRSKK